MAVLTPDEIEAIRLDIGDGCNTITDAQIQLAWDDADGDKCTAYARIAWWIYVKAKPQTIMLTNGGEAISTALIRAYRDRYDEWAACAGLAGGTLSVGTLNLGIDQPCPDEWPDCRE